MRRLFLVVAVASMVVAFAPPASAQHHNTVCRDIVGPNGGYLFRGCITVNTRDTALDHVEALAWSVDDSCAPGPNRHVQFDWVHLYRNGNLVEATGGRTAWQFETCSFGENYSTEWSYPNNPGDDFRAVVRMRGRTQGGLPGPWIKFDTTWTCGDYCA